MKVLGIDVSTYAIGYAILTNGKLTDYGKVSFGGGNQISRIYLAVPALKDFSEKHKYDVLAVEEIPFVNNKTVFGNLSLFFGLTIGALYHEGVRVVLPRPLEWQRYIGNGLLTKTEKADIIKKYPHKSRNWYSERGRERRKQRTATWVKEKYGKTITDNDITDAIAIAYYGSQHG